MAVGAQPDDVFLMQAVSAKMATIKRTDFWTDVATVDFPDYEEDNVAEVFKVDAPFVHIWWTGEIHNAAMEDSQKFRPFMRLMIMGGVKRANGIQFALMGLKNDVRNVMMSNKWDPVGIYTRPAPGFPTVAYYHEGTGPERMASFRTMWDLEYKAPFPGG